MSQNKIAKQNKASNDEPVLHVQPRACAGGQASEVRCLNDQRNCMVHASNVSSQSASAKDALLPREWPVSSLLSTTEPEATSCTARESAVASHSATRRARNEQAVSLGLPAQSPPAPARAVPIKAPVAQGGTIVCEMVAVVTRPCDGVAR